MTLLYASSHTFLYTLLFTTHIGSVRSCATKMDAVFLSLTTFTQITEKILQIGRIMLNITIFGMLKSYGHNNVLYYKQFWIFCLCIYNKIPYRQPNKIIAYLTFHKWPVLVCDIHMSFWCYKPKPVTCEKWVTPLFYSADDIILKQIFSKIKQIETAEQKTNKKKNPNKKLKIKITTRTRKKSFSTVNLYGCYFNLSRI